MNTCPPELHSYIAQLACSSDPTTVHALSLVSQYFRQIAAPFLYQCLALSTPSQIITLTPILESTPQHMRNIHHLFLSIHPDPTNPSHTHTLIFRILTLAAPTLHSLTFVAPSPATSTPLIARLFRTPFPALIELTILGFYPFPPTQSSMPLLKRLHLAGNRNPHGLLQMGALEDASPALTHLRISGLNTALSFALELEHALTNDTDADDPNTNPNTNPASLFPAKLPPHTRRVLVQFGPSPQGMHRKCGTAQMKERAIMQRLRALSGVKGAVEFTLLERSLGDVSGEVVRRQWAERLEGLEGCWAC